MEDEEPTARRSQLRSPPFPFIPLERAIERSRELLDFSKGHPVRAANAVTAWHYNQKSSGGIQTIAALKGFGLIIDSGSNDDRKVQLSELSKRILRNPPENIKSSLLKEAALNSKIISEHWKIWGDNRPPDNECRWDLVDSRGFTDEAAKKFLFVYDKTIQFSGLTKTDMDVSGSETAPSELASDEEFKPIAAAAEPQSGVANGLSKGTRRAVFPLEEGDVTLVFPDGLSSQGYEELSDYIEVFLKKARRGAL